MIDLLTDWLIGWLLFTPYRQYLMKRWSIVRETNTNITKYICMCWFTNSFAVWLRANRQYLDLFGPKSMSKKMNLWKSMYSYDILYYTPPISFGLLFLVPIFYMKFTNNIKQMIQDRTSSGVWGGLAPPLPQSLRLCT